MQHSAHKCSIQHSTSTRVSVGSQDADTDKNSHWLSRMNVGLGPVNWWAITLQVSKPPPSSPFTYTHLYMSCHCPFTYAPHLYMSCYCPFTYAPHLYTSCYCPYTCTPQSHLFTKRFLPTWVRWSLNGSCLPESGVYLFMERFLPTWVRSLLVHWTVPACLRQVFTCSLNGSCLPESGVYLYLNGSCLHESGVYLFTEHFLPTCVRCLLVHWMIPAYLSQLFTERFLPTWVSCSLNGSCVPESGVYLYLNGSCLPVSGVYLFTEWFLPT